MLVGALLALCGFGIAVFAFGGTIGAATTIAIALFFAVVMAKVLGCMLPVLAKSIKLDPALMASPLITTIVDVGSLIILFMVAINVLHV